MNLAPIRSFAMSLDAVTEEPHHNYSSFRVRGKIFVTIPPGEEFIHVFIAEEAHETALALYPEFLEKLLWGGKVQGLRVNLSIAKPAVVKSLVQNAYETRVSKDAKIIKPAKPTKQPQIFKDKTCKSPANATAALSHSQR